MINPLCIAIRSDIIVPDNHVAFQIECRNGILPEANCLLVLNAAHVATDKHAAELEVGGGSGLHFGVVELDFFSSSLLHSFTPSFLSLLSLFLLFTLLFVTSYLQLPFVTPSKMNTNNQTNNQAKDNEAFPATDLTRRTCPAPTPSLYTPLQRLPWHSFPSK